MPKLIFIIKTESLRRRLRTPVKEEIGGFHLNVKICFSDISIVIHVTCNSLFRA